MIICNRIKASFQIVGQNPESYKLQMDLNQAIIGSLSEESTIQDLTNAVLTTLILAEDLKILNKYTLGVVSVKLDGRNRENNPDIDPEYFALAIFDDFTDDQKVTYIKIYGFGRK